MERSVDVVIFSVKPVTTLGGKKEERVFRNTLSYLVPPTDTPVVGDLVVVTATSHVTSTGIAANVKGGEIEKISEPAHPRATKYYLALMPIAQTIERQELNNAREAMYKATEEIL